jgi:hypothetical protein
MLVIVQGGLIGPLTKAFGSERLLTAGFATLIAGFIVLSIAEVWALLFRALALL